MDVEPRYFVKIIKKVNEKDHKNDEKLPELVKFDSDHDQKVFNKYANFFFRLHMNKDIEDSVFSIGQEVSANENEKENGVIMSYKELLDTFTREEEELKKVEKKLDEIEEELDK